MRKAKDTEKTVASGTAAESGAPATAVEKPKRGRKPKAVKKQEEKTVTKEAVNAADTEPAQTPSEALPEAGTAARDTVMEEQDTGEGNAEEEAVTATESREESGAEEPTAQDVPATLSEASAQVVESPLQQMKQEFHRRSQVIRREMGNIQNSFVVIGFQLHWIYENNMFHVLRYKSIYDYAEKEYNIKRTTCCNLINIIENYAERDGNGQVVESIAECYRNYSASQLVAMLGMTEEMKQQVTPDMSVRAINRLRRGEPEPGTVEVSCAEDASPVREDAGKTATVKEVQTAEKQTEDEPMEEYADESADTVREETADTKAAGQAVERAGMSGQDAENGKDAGTGGVEAGRQPQETATADDATLAEIDSYSDYKSMADELDLLMKQVFSADSPVRVKIVCVQG